MPLIEPKRRRFAGEIVTAEMQMAEVRHFNDSQRQLTGHVVVEEIEDLEVLEGSELGWESAIERLR